MTHFDHSVLRLHSLLRASTFALVIAAVLMQGLIGVVHSYQHGAGAQYLTSTRTVTADSASTAQQALTHGDTDHTLCVLCLALQASVHFVGLKTTPLIAARASSNGYVPGPVCGVGESRRYLLAQQRAPPATA